MNFHSAANNICYTQRYSNQLLMRILRLFISYHIAFDNFCIFAAKKEYYLFQILI